MVLITLVSKLFSSSMCVCWLCLNHSKIILGSSSFCGSTFSCPPTSLGCEAVVAIVAVVVGREYCRGRQGSDERWRWWQNGRRKEDTDDDDCEQGGPFSFGRRRRSGREISISFVFDNYTYGCYNDDDEREGGGQIESIIWINNGDDDTSN